MKEQIIVTGYTVDAIEKAFRASFYGIMGHNPDSAAAMRICCEAVEKHLDSTGTNWNWFMVTDATITSTNGRNRTAAIIYIRE